MNQSFNDIYEEIVAMKEDLEKHLENNKLSPYVKELANEELSDIKSILQKWENGQFGICEETGDEIPIELLSLYPTARSFSDLKQLFTFFKKPVFPF